MWAGDNRVHGMETGTALSRAMAWVMDNPFYKVDVINMSYGEHSHTSLAGSVAAATAGHYLSH